MATLTVYPDAGSGNTTVDGQTRRAGVDQTFADIIAGAGTSSDDTGSFLWMGTVASSTNDQFDTVYRSLFTFDTSSMGASTVNSATLSIRGSSSFAGSNLGSSTWVIVSSTPASNNAVVNGDYSQLGSTAYGSVTQASYNTGGYNDITLNASGQGNINPTGISKFGVRSEWDRSGTFGGSWLSGGVSRNTALSADNSGTTNDPKLTIDYDQILFIPKAIIIT